MTFTKIIKEWGLAVVVFIILTTTAVGTEITSFAQSLILKTGIITLDDDSINPEEAEDFNYDVQIKDFNGNELSLTSFKGKLIFLNIWASWCGPCRAEMPGIQELYEDIDSENIVFVMLSFDRNEKAAINYLNDKEYTFPSYVLNGNPTKQINVPSLPTTMVISPEGKIIKKKVGMAKYNTRSFKAYLEQSSVKK